ncbi:unnamed protein product [Symbiodinium sp. CCMP2592]|nr:unnamed protein product [Symbiodinium sp. CCMP2592]
MDVCAGLIAHINMDSGDRLSGGLPTKGLINFLRTSKFADHMDEAESIKSVKQKRKKKSFAKKAAAKPGAEGSEEITSPPPDRASDDACADEDSASADSERVATERSPEEPALEERRDSQMFTDVVCPAASQGVLEDDGTDLISPVPQAKTRRMQTTWPPDLDGKTAFFQLKEHELPGDGIASMHFNRGFNFKPFIFLPSVLLAAMSDSPVLTYETAHIPNSGTAGVTCAFGKPVSDIFQKKEYCPIIAGMSPWYWAVGWYSAFLLTVGICHICGRRIPIQVVPGVPNATYASPICRFLDVQRAGYDDNHLLGFFLLITACFVHSMMVRFVATPEGKDWGHACLRYGSWQGYEDYCQPGPLMEPSWTVFLVLVSVCAMCALWDQGTVVEGSEDRKDESGYAEDVTVDRLDAAAVNLKAIIRFQMSETERLLEAEPTRLAMFIGWNKLQAWLAGKDPPKKAVRRTTFLTVNFFSKSSDDMPDKVDLDAEGVEGETDFTVRFYCKKTGKCVRSFHDALLEVLRLAGSEDALPDALQMAKEDLEVQILGAGSEDERAQLLKDFFRRRLMLQEGKMGKVHIKELYSFCDDTMRILGNTVETNSDGASRSSKARLSCLPKKPSDDLGIIDRFLDRWHLQDVVGRRTDAYNAAGYLFTAIGCIITSIISPQADAWAIVYWLANKDGLVEDRCEQTSSVGFASPWCSTAASVSMQRRTFRPEIAFFTTNRNVWLVCLCFLAKLGIFGVLGYYFAETVRRTIRGLMQAAHPMVILNSILLHWAQLRSVNTSQLHVWKRVRDSILFNDVKFILDRFENIVIAYLGVAFWLISDSTYQIVLRNEAPTFLAFYVIVFFTAATAICLGAALSCHLAQEEHTRSLTRLREASMLRTGKHVEHQRALLDMMIQRLDSGGDYQTKMLYMPLNPKLQKVLLGYVVVSAASVVGRLVSNELPA